MEGVEGQLYKLLPEIKDVAFVRELHTYGQLVSLKHKNIKTLKQTNNEVQHHGLGKKLLKEAEKIAKKNGFKKLAVISGIGVRDYYKKSGYLKKGRYMLKSI